MIIIFNFLFLQRYPEFNYFSVFFCNLKLLNSPLGDVFLKPYFHIMPMYIFGNYPKGTYNCSVMYFHIPLIPSCLK